MQSEWRVALKKWTSYWAFLRSHGGIPATEGNMTELELDLVISYPESLCHDHADPLCNCMSHPNWLLLLNTIQGMFNIIFTSVHVALSSLQKLNLKWHCVSYSFCSCCVFFFHYANIVALSCVRGRASSTTDLQTAKLPSLKVPASLSMLSAGTSFTSQKNSLVSSGKKTWMFRIFFTPFGCCWLSIYQQCIEGLWYYRAEGFTGTNICKTCITLNTLQMCNLYLFIHC